ncbi:MAG: ABC transporter permease subunit [Pirellulaceae bacterium]
MAESLESRTSATAAAPRQKRRHGKSSYGTSILAGGEAMVWFTGGSLVVSLVMVIGLLVLVLYLGLSTFKVLPVVRIETSDGRVLMGEVSQTETFSLSANTILRESPAAAANMIRQLAESAGDLTEIPRQIQDHAAELESQKKNSQKKLDLARTEFHKQLTQLQGKLHSPADRQTWIAANGQSQHLRQLQDNVDALTSQVEGLEAEIENQQNAAQQWSQLIQATSPLDVLLDVNADYSVRTAGVDALIRLAAAATDDDHVQASRQLIRTGNFDLTNQHFDWVTDFQIRENGVSYPEDAVVLERVAWGRFYGRPKAFVQLAPRNADQLERAIQAELELVSSHQHLVAEKDLAAVEELKTQLEQLAQQARSQTNATYLDMVRTEQNALNAPLVYAVAADGSEQPLAETSPDEDVTSCRFVWDSADAAWQQFESHHAAVRERFQEAQHLRKHALGHEYEKQERSRLKLRQAEIDQDLQILPRIKVHAEASAQRQYAADQLASVQNTLSQLKKRFAENSKWTAALDRWAEKIVSQSQSQLDQAQQQLDQATNPIEALPENIQSLVQHHWDVMSEAEEQTDVINQKIALLDAQNSIYQLQMVTADDQTVSIALGDVVRGYQANQLDATDKRAVYWSRWWEFLTDEPREANSEGGVLPAIWGTVIMTLIMSVAVVPFGVLAALYLREYAKSGPVVSVIRIAINNLAGVPSIVFGVFGLGFFCYIIGAFIDGGAKNAGFTPLPSGRWYLTLGALALLSTGAFLTGVFSMTGRPSERNLLKRILAPVSFVLWALALAALISVLMFNPYFHGFYEAQLPNPQWGKGGVLWAALTLSLMTLPVVIVATEEALAAVPNSMREGSYGCGASKWQTIRRIVLPHALPGIMTGMILAMARGAGEVAPLMLVGAVKLAPELPIDGAWPFVHGDRSFMHLGFHIFDLGFQSQNSDAAKPMVYTTTLLLIAIIAALNILAISLRAYLRKRFESRQF